MTQIRQGGRSVFFTKIKLVLPIVLNLPIYVIALPVVLLLRLMRPWLLVRIEQMYSHSLGHFAANTELYLCEREAGINNPVRRHLDLFYWTKPICNMQLANMWERVLNVWPTWILAPIDEANRLIPGGDIHTIGKNTQHDRDVHNLLDRFPPHLHFSAQEITRGETSLRKMGIPTGTPFVCLTVRDDAYLTSHLRGDFSYHNYRDSDVQNYVRAAEELADRGYFVIRMGARVRAAINSSHPRVIDYATNGMRTAFMDIYLGAKCAFCISVGTGFDAIPLIFRKPIVYVNMVPLGYLFTFRESFLGITKHHVLTSEDRKLTLKEIFLHDVGLSLRASDYESKGIQLIENSPSEICEVVIEMADRLAGTWRPHKDDEALQELFWAQFPKSNLSRARRPLHGEIRARFGASFLRDNREWLL